MCTLMIQTTVRSVTQRPDFSLSGQWDIVTINRDGEEERHVFDAVLVCKGPNTHPVLPLSDFPGQSTNSYVSSSIPCFTFDRIWRIKVGWFSSSSAYFVVVFCCWNMSPGHETFSGRCLHSWEYKDADACRGKRVVVVGIGNSGGDIAVEISRSADKVRQSGKPLSPMLLDSKNKWS